MNYSVRDLVYIGVFAACWGAVEITAGSVLHALNVPFGGVALTGVGVGVALVGRLYGPRPGSVFFIAVVTALLKMLSIGGIILSPMVAITIEGLIAELMVAGLGTTAAGFVAAGTLACLWPLIHTVLSLWAVGRAGLVESYLTMLQRGANALGVPASWGSGLLAILVLLHLGIGAVAGGLAWRIGQGLRRRGRDWPGVTSGA
jgi:hypothetical protein